MAASVIPPMEIPADPVEDAPSGDTNFAEIADSGFGETPEEPVVEQGAAEPTVPTTVAAETPAPTPEVVVEAPPSAPAVVAPPTTPPVPEVVAQPAVAPPVVEAPAPQPAAMSEADMKVARTKLVDDISANYRLSEDDKVALATDPDKVLPRIAGSLFVDVLEATTRVVAQQVPLMIQRHLAEQNDASAKRSAFFGKFPGLNKPEYIPALQQVTASYKALNPKVPYDVAVDAIGKLAHALLGIPLSEGTVSTPAAAPPAVRPAAPLQPGSAARNVAPAGASNIFSELASFELVDD